MNTVIEGLRQLIGKPDFVIASGDLAGTYDYAAMSEYFAAVLLLCITVASVFRLLGKLVSR